MPLDNSTTDAVFTWIFTPEYFDVEDFGTSDLTRVEMMQMLDNIKHLKAHVVGKIEADIALERSCEESMLAELPEWEDVPSTRRMDFSLPE